MRRGRQQVLQRSLQVSVLAQATQRCGSTFKANAEEDGKPETVGQVLAWCVENDRFDKLPVKHHTLPPLAPKKGWFSGGSRGQTDSSETSATQVAHEPRQTQQARLVVPVVPTMDSRSTSESASNEISAVFDAWAKRADACPSYELTKAAPQAYHCLGRYIQHSTILFHNEVAALKKSTTKTGDPVADRERLARAAGNGNNSNGANDSSAESPGVVNAAGNFMTIADAWNKLVEGSNTVGQAIRGAVPRTSVSNFAAGLGTSAEESSVGSEPGMKRERKSVLQGPPMTADFASNVHKMLNHYANQEFDPAPHRPDFKPLSPLFIASPRDVIVEARLSEFSFVPRALSRPAEEQPATAEEGSEAAEASPQKKSDDIWSIATTNGAERSMSGHYIELLQPVAAPPVEDDKVYTAHVTLELTVLQPPRRHYEFFRAAYECITASNDRVRIFASHFLCAAQVSWVLRGLNHVSRMLRGRPLEVTYEEEVHERVFNGHTATQLPASKVPTSAFRKAMSFAYHPVTKQWHLANLRHLGDDFTFNGTEVKM